MSTEQRLEVLLRYSLGIFLINAITLNEYYFLEIIKSSINSIRFLIIDSTLCIYGGSWTYGAKANYTKGKNIAPPK